MDKKFIVSKLKLKFIIIINKKKGGLDNYVYIDLLLTSFLFFTTHNSQLK